MRQKTLMLLGGSQAQLVAIKSAKEYGCRTVLCDYLPDNPGRYLVDKFYLTSTTDLESILQIARDEGIDGVVAYGSDPAAPTAAYVASELGLPGIDYRTALDFCEKHRFRQFLADNGFHVPNSREISYGEAINGSFLEGLKFPLVIKPTDSSGSKGITVLDHPSDLDGAIDIAKARSRNGVLIVEEFIQRDHPHVIEGEIFVLNGGVVSWGLINSIRDPKTNPLLPAGYSYPLDLDPERVNLVRREISRLVAASGVKNGAFNLEMIITKNEELFFLDVGPRNGGNMLPEFISMINGKNLPLATVRVAVGETDNLDVSLDGYGGGGWGLAVLHSQSDGKFENVEYSSEASKALVRECLDVCAGDTVKKFTVCSDLVGLSFFKFDTEKAMHEVMYNMDSSLSVSVK